MIFRPRTPRQRDEDRAALEKLIESDAWGAFVRSARERQYLHAHTLTVSDAPTPEQAFVLVHRQQALIADLEQFLADPLEWLVPGMPGEDEEVE